MLYGDINLLVVWRYQAISRTSVEFSLMWLSGIQNFIVCVCVCVCVC